MLARVDTVTKQFSPNSSRWLDRLLDYGNLSSLQTLQIPPNRRVNSNLPLLCVGWRAELLTERPGAG